MTFRRGLLGGLILLLIAWSITAAVLLASDDDEQSNGGSYGGVNGRFDSIPQATRRGKGRRRVTGAPSKERSLVRFVEFVAGDVQRFWQGQFRAGGQQYVPAEVVLFRRRVRTGCGAASSAVGPFYCPADARVYLDLSFFRALSTAFRAPGDFAQAYVIAHEFGHHVQTLTGVTQQVQLVSEQDPAIRNPLSVRAELQADCLAGVWAHSTYERGLLEQGDLQEAINAAAAVGDDRVQAATTGRIMPETWTHGSSAQRVTWLTRGFESGDPQACDTFATPQV